LNDSGEDLMVQKNRGVFGKILTDECFCSTVLDVKNISYIFVIMFFVISCSSFFKQEIREPLHGIKKEIIEIQFGYWAVMDGQNCACDDNSCNTIAWPSQEIERIYAEITDRQEINEVINSLDEKIYKEYYKEYPEEELIHILLRDKQGVIIAQAIIHDQSEYIDKDGQLLGRSQWLCLRKNTGKREEVWLNDVDLCEYLLSIYNKYSNNDKFIRDDVEIDKIVEKYYRSLNKEGFIDDDWLKIMGYSVEKIGCASNQIMSN